MAVFHDTDSIKGYVWNRLKQRNSQLFKRGSFSRLPHSQNKNPSAVRTVGGRQTYQERDYAGIAGEFLPEQKILIRYNENDLFDMDIIEDMENRIEEIARSHEEYDADTLECGKEVIEEALKRYTPIDTGNLVSHWQVSIDYEKAVINIENSVEYASNQEYGMYGDQDDGKSVNSKGKTVSRSVWYPGYYMMTKSIHEGEIAMREYARLKQEELRNRAENG